MKRLSGDGPNPSGLCQCGCGQPAPLAQMSSTRRGWIKGKPVRFIYQHQCYKHPRPYEVDADTGCWVWMRGKNPSGYGYTTRGGKKISAHRVYWENINGPIPKDMTVDHLCNNPSCVNPGHMVLATQIDNTMRGSSPAAMNARKTHCAHGHPFTEENTYVNPDGKRHCRTCDADRQRRYRAERSAKNV